MFDKPFESYAFRQRCLTMGLNKDATEIYTYLNEVTDRGIKGPEVLENLSLTDRVSLFALKAFPSLRPHLNDIRKLYEDPRFRQEWYRKYENLFLKDGQT